MRYFYKRIVRLIYAITGSLDLSSRELTRIPTYLFVSHLEVNPEPLKLAPPEVVEPEAPEKVKKRAARYEQEDLSILKAWNNQLVELQPELSLFGSLKVVDVSNLFYISECPHVHIRF